MVAPGMVCDNIGHLGLIRLYLNLTGGCFLPLFATMASLVSEMDIFVPKRFVFGQVEALFWSCAWFVHPVFKNKEFFFCRGGVWACQKGPAQSLTATPLLWGWYAGEVARWIPLIRAWVSNSWFTNSGPWSLKIRLIFAPLKAWICLQVEIQSIKAKTSRETTTADLFSTGTKNWIKMPVLSCSTLSAAAIKYRFSSKL